VRLYWHPFSIIPWRVRIALREKSLACEEIEVDIPRSAQRSEAFLRLNPFGQLPVLEDGDLVISESIAILEYLDERYPTPPLLPRDPAQRAVIRQLMLWGTDYWPPAWKQWMAPRMGQGDPAAPTVQEGRAELGRHLDVLAARLVDHDWLCGAYSLADVCYAPLVLVLDRVDLGDLVSARPPIAAWVARLLARPAVRAAMMPPAPTRQGVQKVPGTS
jgi:glutathione S-transferase